MLHYCLSCNAQCLDVLFLYEINKYIYAQVAQLLKEKSLYLSLFSFTDQFSVLTSDSATSS